MSCCRLYYFPKSLFLSPWPVPYYFTYDSQFLSLKCWWQAPTDLFVLLDWFLEYPPSHLWFWLYYWRLWTAHSFPQIISIVSIFLLRNKRCLYLFNICLISDLNERASLLSSCFLFNFQSELSKAQIMYFSNLKLFLGSPLKIGYNLVSRPRHSGLCFSLHLDHSVIDLVELDSSTEAPTKHISLTTPQYCLQKMRNTNLHSLRQ